MTSHTGTGTGTGNAQAPSVSRCTFRKGDEIVNGTENGLCNGLDIVTGIWTEELATE